MLFVIRNGRKLSAKALFFIELYKLSNDKIFVIYKDEKASVTEEWSYSNAQLSSSFIGLLMYYMLMIVKSPKDLRNGLMARLSFTERKNLLAGEGFLSTFARTLQLYFGSSAKADNLKYLLSKINSEKTFLIDEFVSLNVLNLKELKEIGSIIYISQDIAYERFGFSDNFATRNLMYNLERNAMVYFDAVIACSGMERLKYLQMGAKRALYYPNIYPTGGFKLEDKDEMPSISIVLRPHWGPIAEKSLETIFNSLKMINRHVKVYLFGIKPTHIPKNIDLQYLKFLPTKADYLSLLSRSWIGINIGVHAAGTNERKYDYAESGTVILSDMLGSRGDLLPYEYTFIDDFDLADKISQLIILGKEHLDVMGKENRKSVLMIAQSGQRRLLQYIDKAISPKNRINTY